MISFLGLMHTVLEDGPAAASAICVGRTFFLEWELGRGREMGMGKNWRRGHGCYGVLSKGLITMDMPIAKDVV